MRPGRGAGSSCNPCRDAYRCSSSTGGSLRSPRLSSFRPAGAEYVTVFRKSCTKTSTLEPIPDRLRFFEDLNAALDPWLQSLQLFDLRCAVTPRNNLGVEIDRLFHVLLGLRQHILLLRGVLQLLGAVPILQGPHFESIGKLQPLA